MRAAADKKHNRAVIIHFMTSCLAGGNCTRPQSGTDDDLLELQTHTKASVDGAIKICVNARLFVIKSRLVVYAGDVLCIVYI